MACTRILLAGLLSVALPVMADEVDRPVKSSIPRPELPETGIQKTTPHRLDPSAGDVRFGDGEHGRRPSASRPSEGAANGSKTSGRSVPETLRHRDRAVTGADYEPLSPKSPGKSIHRPIRPVPQTDPEQSKDPKDTQDTNDE